MSALAGAPSLVTTGRGPTLAIAREAALKLKETCNLHAEAFSGAEFLHGPVALVSPDYPILMFMPTDAAAEGMQRLAADLRGKGAALFTSGTETGGGVLPALAPDQPEADAVCLIQSFYCMIVRLADALGMDAGSPAICTRSRAPYEPGWRDEQGESPLTLSLSPWERGRCCTRRAIFRVPSPRGRRTG